jgi:muconolactone delta-isomerase
MSIELRNAAAAATPAPKNRDEILALREERDPGKSMTKQSFKDATDINRLLSRAQKAGTLSHLERFQGNYADFSDFDFHTAQNTLAEARTIFDALPSEIKKEFDHDPAAFFAYANDPENADDLEKKLPGLAEPGRQHIETRRTADTEAVAEAVSAAVTAAFEANAERAPSEAGEAGEAPEEPSASSTT